MSDKKVMFLAFLFIGALLVNRLMEGAYFKPADVALLNDLTIFRTVRVFDLFNMPFFNLSFFTVALPKLISWDYSYFGGGYQIVKYFLYAISAGVVWAAIITYAGIVYYTWRG